MIPESVTLVVKAPNQQIEDQNIECQSSWTVAQLKGHLSKVYPSKPNTDEQKIIYSGQLLEDTTILKDVLRKYDSEIAHTMHLVCTPKRLTAAEQKKKPEAHTEGLRRRTVSPENPGSETRVETNRPETRQNDQNHSVEMQNYFSSFANNYGRVPPYPNYSFGTGYLPVTNDPAAMANHMMMMQQAYIQYMQQYANMWQAGGGTAVPGAQPMNVVNEVPPQPATEPPAEPPQDDDAMPRDWLDLVYAGSRLAILFSLVYFYSSPFRLLLVALLCAMGYLHQVGFFRDVNPLNENQPQRNEPVRQENPRVPEQNASEPQIPQTTENTQINQQSLLAVTWMIFTSFFTSLIPETN